MLADVFQFGGLLGIGVKQGFDTTAIVERPVVVFFGPNGRRFHDQRFAIRIEFVGHGKESGWMKDESKG